MKNKSPFSEVWKEWRKDYIKESPISYYLMCRRDGALYAVEKFQTYHFWARLIPEMILFKYFCWYGSSKIGRWMYNRSKQRS